jgi:hypothetical protein
MPPFKCKPLVPSAAPDLNVPAWVDPRLIMTLCAYRISTVTLNMSAKTDLARADPTRVAIGFSAGNNSLGSIFVAPQVDPQLYGWLLGTSMAASFFTLFDIGPLVCASWSAYSSIGSNLAVYEVTRQS